MMFHKEWARSCMRCHGKKQESLNGRPGFLAYVIGRGIGEVKCILGFCSYNDDVLRQSALDILSGPYFLNDCIIEFYFSYLPWCYPSEEILLVLPSIAFWIANCPDIESLKDLIEPLNLSSKKLEIFPVNNNDDVTEAEGGNHWSLLVFERNSNVFVRHDSYRGLNAGHAKQLYRAIVGYMGIYDMASACTYVECSKTPQQVNGYNCGLYGVAIAKAICSWYESRNEPNDDDGLWFSTMNEQVNPSVVDETRTVIKKLNGHEVKILNCIGVCSRFRNCIHIDIYKMRKSAANEKILSYNDVVLRRSDLDILSGPYFLNDRIIEFCFSYLPSCYPSKEILLVSPSIAFWIANCPDIESLKDFIEPLNLSSKKLQVNGYDCGLYIAAIVKAICRWYESKREPKDEDGLWFSTMNKQVNPSVVAEMRNEILGLVKSLMAMK
ncbi:NEDD8-specific protease 1 [Camellia lanceoleosa]|uniref:NEDD8-specific protease 1 n=1 Tax=Camellia lanceoleosa TaxID=1840588 RepID=A0ACC0F4V7_9ERIC|nr:NEDD8-specific protease 1 [Camellia lanceoleosa]